MEREKIPAPSQEGGGKALAPARPGLPGPYSSHEDCRAFQISKHRVRTVVQLARLERGGAGHSASSRAFYEKRSCSHFHPPCHNLAYVGRRAGLLNGGSASARQRGGIRAARIEKTSRTAEGRRAGRQGGVIRAPPAFPPRPARASPLTPSPAPRWRHAGASTARSTQATSPTC